MIGQNIRPVKRPVILLGICLFLLLYVLWDKRHEIIPSHDRTPQIALKRDSVKEKDSIYYEDKKILDKLRPVLKAREGFSAVSYFDHYANYYQGYGHLLTTKNTDAMPVRLTERQADSILINDLKICYWENERIKRKTEFRDIYNIFISGKK